ncbi:hypothetical protein DFR30_2027 [Thiogranum longum]|uniref:Secreted protein with PEP-CTERM sorting signal n=1 Tax=Thiogranum longum TaxID=1537524 RepID=A0A4R1HDN2_9GAMM|nr:hypothetical protein [Thiogranum longum]TCK18743.1 hypothetical protein DFR30_2027 [Thiogranum longum]
MNMLRQFLLACSLLVFMAPVLAHHVLGRPAYSLNEDSNTPPSMQVETQIGNYFVTYMVYPAFPRAGEPGRINLYASHMDSGEPFTGEVTFSVRDDTWFGGAEPEQLGVQPPDDNVFRQGFVFSDDGRYIIRAEFQADGEPYLVDFPLRIGQPSPVGPVTLSVVALLVVLIAANLFQRKRLQRDRIRTARHDERVARSSEEGAP